MRYFNLFNIAILLVLASCGRSYDNPEIIDPPIVQPLILPVKITINNDAIYNVSYDGQKVKELTGNKGGKILFTYDGELITNIQSYNNEKLISEYSYTYINNRLIKENQYYPAYGTKTFIYEYLDNAKVQISHSETFASRDYTVSGIYNLTNGMITSGASTGTGYESGIKADFKENIQVAYITKNFPFKNVKGFDKLINYDLSFMGKAFASYSNIVEYRKDNGATGNIFKIYKSTFNYNTMDYPVSEIQKPYNIDGTPYPLNPVAITYEYNY
ncbi:hypothetical protein [Elizabethkingia occulta]|uniref:hypothetical protein n=1 Tax=Elizabethkingia occulta TaxID=1867263 RepID=UPI00398C74EC